MFLLTISYAWNDDGEISSSVEKELLFSTEQKANDYLATLKKIKNRTITITKHFVDSEKNSEVIKDEWWCE